MTNPDESNHEEGNAINYKLTYALDRHHFFRRECSNCGLHFKIKAGADTLAHTLAPLFQRIEKESSIHLSTASENTANKSYNLTCPYCGHSDDVKHMNTDEFTQYVIRWLRREFVYPSINKLFGDMSRTFGNHSSITFEHQPMAKLIRPISGPELPDMTLVQILCCKNAIKILDGWSDTIYCPFCSQLLALQ